jgi:site-specific recombinase XerD
MVAHMKRLLVTQGYSPQTRDTYIRWTQRFTKFLGHPHPRQIGTKEIASVLDHLANDRGLSAATRNQATAAIKYLMREVLASDAADSIKNSKGPKYVPTVLSRPCSSGHAFPSGLWSTISRMASRMLA